MMEANDYQIGGEHYQNEYQHWDFVVDANLNYLEGCATKYVSRHRDKNGLQDLQKSLHYVAKIQEVYGDSYVVEDSRLKVVTISFLTKVIAFLSKHHKLIHVANWLSDKITLSQYGKFKYNKRLHALYKFGLGLPHEERFIVEEIVHGRLDNAIDALNKLAMNCYTDTAQTTTHYFEG